MPLQLVRQGIRLRTDERRRGPLLDAFTHATPQGWVRAATQFEVALARGGVLVDVGNLSSVTLEASPETNRDGARVFSRTLAGSALDASLTEATWADGSKQHALFTFSSAEMNVALGGEARADFWLVVTALTTVGDPLVCGAGKFTLVDDGAFAAAPPPPANPGAGITVAQADTRYAQAAGVLNFAPGITGTTGGDGVHLDGVSTAALPTYYALLVRETGQGLTGWVLEPDADPATGARVVVPGDHGAGNLRSWRQRI